MQSVNPPPTPRPLPRLRGTALAALAALSLGSSAYSRPPLALHTSGNRLCDSDGNTVVLKGVNIPSVEWMNGGDHAMQSVEEAIHRWHVNIIRLPIAQDRWMGRMPDEESGLDLSDGGASYRRLVDSLVNAASAEGVYMIVDLHWSDMGVWGRNVGQHRMPDANTAVAWESIAERYANNPAVLFDIYNEPHEVSWSVWRNGGHVTEEAGSYETPGMQALVDVVRGAHASNVVVVGGLDFAFDLRGVAGGYAISSPNVLYSCHIYPSKSPDWDLQVSGAAKIAPVVIGEFGADEFSTESASFVPRVIDWIDSHHYSAIAWCMHTSARPCLISDWNYHPTFGFGRYVLSWLTGGPPPPTRLACDGGPGRISLSWRGCRGRWATMCTDPRRPFGRTLLLRLRPRWPVRHTLTAGCGTERPTITR